MAAANPFTPSFGGKPEHFFGRETLLTRMREALDGADSPDRVLFITGTRGCGKTALLERLSLLASESSWLTIDVHSTTAVRDILEELTSQTPTVSAKLEPKISALGASVSLGEVNASRVGSLSKNLTSALLARCETLGGKRGIFITIDEIQKISEADMEQICAAVQMARRKGQPVALMLAGLPGAKEKVAAYQGCTFMQQAKDEQIGSLLVSETVQAFTSLFALVPDLVVSEDTIWAASAMSQGYPYLVQLVGYHLVQFVRDLYPVGVIQVLPEHVSAIAEQVYETYRNDVLAPSTRTLGDESRAYLAVMSTLLDDDGIAATGAIAKALGKETSQLSTCRQRLISRRLIRSEGYGKVRFALPYLSRYAVERAKDTARPTFDEWKTR